MTPPQRPLTRRNFLELAGLGVAASALSACRPGNEAAIATTTPASPATSTPEPTATPLPGPKLVARFAHISDMHIEEAGPSREHFSRAVRNISLLDPPVEFVVNAGDCVMDVLFSNKDEALAQWDRFLSVLPPDFPLPVYHAIGNHDVWGWGLPADEQAVVQSDPLYGKGMILQKLGLSSRYYSFVHEGWRFFVLDSIHLADQVFDHPYTGKLDDEQFDWLTGELEATDPAMHVCIISHVPIFGACGLLDSSEASGNWILPGPWQHIDARRIINLLWQHPNVKLCMSGHTHQLEDLRHHGIKYISDGAISGNWWKGAYYDFAPGYMLVNLYDDGSSELEFIAY